MVKVVLLDQFIKVEKMKAAHLWENHSGYTTQNTDNCIRVWQELVDIFPEEKDMYIRESRKLRYQALKEESLFTFSNRQAISFSL
jgi:hypothetical protein